MTQFIASLRTLPRRLGPSTHHLEAILEKCCPAVFTAFVRFTLAVRFRERER
jgi:hypothetical protein